MSKRNSLLAHKNNANSTIHDELVDLKYKLDNPHVSIYPLDTKTKQELQQERGKAGDFTFPDFKPWKDHTQLSGTSGKEEEGRMTNSMFLNKGLFEGPQVSNEYYSARNLIQATMFSSSANCSEAIKELSQHLASVYKTRNDIINKINYDSNNFKLPPKVTLTTSKRDAWINELADPKIPLHKIGSRVPHGIKNKVLLDTLCSKLVPPTRAIWFTKCVLYGDVMLIRKKAPKTDQIESQESLWLQEWTQQVVDYLYRFSKDFNNVSTPEKKQEYMNKLRYLLKYIQTIYIESLVDKDLFLTLLMRFFKDGLVLDSNSVIQLLVHSRSSDDETYNEEEYDKIMKGIDINYGQRLVALMLIKIFWLDILKLDFLCKDLCEVLLLNYYFMTAKKNDYMVSESIKERVFIEIAEIIRYLFKYNSNYFIIPNYWVLINDVLYSVVRNKTKSEETTSKEDADTEKQFQLISFRNESLVLNMKHGPKQDHKRTGSFPNSYNYESFSPFSGTNGPPTFGGGTTNIDAIESEIFITRKNDDILKIIEYLDKSKLNEELANLISPDNKDTNWVLNLSIIIMWCITKYRIPDCSHENILMVCGFVKNKVMKNPRIKSLIENTIFDIIYSFTSTNDMDINNLFVLINELYQLKVISISSYLRKLIASGIFYVPPGADIDRLNHQINLHLSILKNLPVLKNKQCENILKRWDINFNYSVCFEQGKNVLTNEILDNFKTNRPINYDFDYFQNLEIGIKYLLVNWLTDELKSIIYNSSKLIHIKLSTLLKVYEFYSLCDNLTVFFRTFIRSILKNESKIIILDVEVLYMISKLVIRHFKLIKTLSNNESNLIGYELFKLIVLNYKDSNEEFDYLNFKPIWLFISKSVTIAPRGPIKGPLPLFSKPTVDSPMRSTNVSDSNETINEFLNEVTQLINTPTQVLKQSEVIDILGGLKLSEDLVNDHKKLVLVLLDYYNKFFTRMNESNEIQLIKLLVNSKVCLDGFIFNECLVYFVSKSLAKVQEGQASTQGEAQQEEELNPILEVLKKLIIYEMIDLQTLTNILQSLPETNHLLFQLCIGQDSSIPLEINREAFIKTTTIFDIISQEPLHNYTPKVYNIFKELIFKRSRSLFENIVKFSEADVIDIFNHLIDQHIYTFNDCLTNMSINEFNLPIYQLLLRLLIKRDFKYLSVNEKNENLEKLVLKVLANIGIRFSAENSYFGELFNVLYIEEKVSISKIIESIFFNSLRVEGDEFVCRLEDTSGGDNLGGDNLGGDNLGAEYLLIFYDYFKKFSVSSIDSIDINQQFFNNLLSVLNHLITHTQSKSFEYCLSIFLRLVIIHKTSIATFLINDDNGLQFATKLNQLYSQSITNDKLLISLYDLFLIFKGLVFTKLSKEVKDDVNYNKFERLIAIFNIPEPDNGIDLTKYIDDTKVKTSIMLTEDELAKGGDYQSLNNGSLTMLSESNETYSPFNLLSETTSKSSSFKIKSFEILQDTSGGINDGRVNLSVFDAYTSKQNPP